MIGPRNLSGTGATNSIESNVAGLHEQMARMYESLANELDRPRYSVAPAW